MFVIGSQHPSRHNADVYLFNSVQLMPELDMFLLLEEVSATISTTTFISTTNAGEIESNSPAIISLYVPQSSFP